MQSLFELTGKNAILTGSGRGLGLTFAKSLAEAGATVIVNDIDQAAVDAAVSSLRDAGHKAYGRAFDVTDSEAVEDGIAWAEKEVGGIDVLFNNAGIHRRAPLLDMPEISWRSVIDTNLTSAFLVGRRVAKGMIRRGSGKIVNICSMNCERTRPGIGNYSAAKGGLVLLTRSMCVEWAKHNIQVNGLAPGYILTELTRPLSEDPELNAWVMGLTPAGRWGTPEDLVGAAIFLSSGASNFVNGHVLFIDGGMRYAL